ncbi:hypothetical protein [Gordonia sp. KTR9]|uniref:hypothetical protein n=1 Tax=Gordonia sp. KTR9 TaxID=337191 RepID=UPI0002E837D2|nr:hypothetical protein [Gordonia sp. KTR9]
MAEEQIEQIPLSDWTDQDLLTNELAESLLEKEIEQEETTLASLGEAEAAPVRRRIAAMRSAQESARARRSK